MKRSVAVLGDVADVNTWSNTPWYFYKAGEKTSLFQIPWKISLDRYKFKRLFWNGWQLIKSGGYGGFQYSHQLLDHIEKDLPKAYLSSEVISFNQCFPRAETIERNHGKSWRYIDATLVQLFGSPSYNMNVTPNIQKKAIDLERRNYQDAEGVVAMSRWAAASIIRDYDIPRNKVHVILPGANIDISFDFKQNNSDGRPGADRPFRMVFIGKDWKRKGLPLLINVAEALIKLGWKIEIVVIGYAPDHIVKLPFVDYAGFIDKSADISKFIQVISSCDMGCLFSESEALGISILEFLRLGIPVLGYANQGMADTIPPDAGFRIQPNEDVKEISGIIDGYLNSVESQNRLQENARNWSELITWERCVREWEGLLDNHKILRQVQPWKGLKEQNAG